MPVLLLKNTNMLNVIFFFSFFSCILLFKVSKDDITVKIASVCDVASAR